MRQGERAWQRRDDVQRLRPCTRVTKGPGEDGVLRSSTAGQARCQL